MGGRETLGKSVIVQSPRDPVFGVKRATQLLPPAALQTLRQSMLPSPMEIWSPVSGTEVAQLQSAAEAFPGH